MFRSDKIQTEGIALDYNPRQVDPYDQVVSEV